MENTNIKVSQEQAKEYISKLTKEEKITLYALLKSLQDNPALLQTQKV